MLIIDDRYEVYNDNLEIDKFYKVKDIETNSYVFLKKLEQNKNIKDSIKTLLFFVYFFIKSSIVTSSATEIL